MNLRNSLKIAYMCALSLVFCSGAAMAQENGNRDANGKIVRGPYETNRAFDNFFIGVGGGVNVYVGESDAYGSFGKRIAPAVDVYFGKWFTPTIGARLGYSGLSAKGWTKDGAYAKGKDGDLYKEKFGVSYLHGDFMWNFSDAVSGYKETRTWNFIPFVGAGWARSYGNDVYDNEFAVSVGLLNNIRLGNVVDLTLEARHMFVNQRFDYVATGRKAEGMTSVTLGLAFKLNRRGFKRVTPPVDVNPYLAKIKALEGDNKTLADANKSLADENEMLRNRKPEVVATNTVTASPVVLFFDLNKTTLDKKELANLDFYVNHAMKADNTKVFTLVGSADKATGNAEINRRLSEQRMEYVYNLLVNKYGIPAYRLVKKVEGDTNNRFADPELNRAVIVE